jgi:hypothetical protein
MITFLIGPKVRIAPNLVAFSNPSAFQEIFGSHGNVRKNELYAANSASRSPNTITASDHSMVSLKRKPHLRMWSERSLKQLEPRVLSKISTFKSILVETQCDSAASWGSIQDMASVCSHLTLSQNADLQHSDKFRWILSAMKIATWRASTVRVAQIPPILHTS